MYVQKSKYIFTSIYSTEIEMPDAPQYGLISVTVVTARIGRNKSRIPLSGLVVAGSEWLTGTLSHCK